MSVATTLARRTVGKLQARSTTFLLCDIQERFRDVIWHFPQVIRTAKLMTAVGKHLEIPTLATEQYPKAFGPTVGVCMCMCVCDIFLRRILPGTNTCSIF